MANKILNWKYELALIAVSGLLLFTGLDKIEVNIMEARNFTTAREMVQNKEYLLTTLNGEPRYQKPPLPTWLTAISGKVFGFNSLYALRLPVVLITILMVLTFFHLSKRIGFSPCSSFNNALILITSFYIFWAGRDNQWDMYTHSFMLVSIYFLWELFQQDKHELLNSLLAGLFIGFSFLSKGPISFYALLLPFLISYGIVYRIPLQRKILYILTTLLVGLTIGQSWYVFVRFSDPESFRAIASREVSNWGTYEIKPFYYYWDFFLQSGLWAIPSLTALVYPYLKKRVSDLKAYQFAILWTIISVILLSLIPEKKVRYLVPALIPLALTTGFYIEYLMRHFNGGLNRIEKILCILSFGIIAFIGIVNPFALLFLLKEGIKDYLFIYVSSSLLMCVFTFRIIKGLGNENFQKVFYTSIALFILIVVSVLPMSGEFFNNSDYAPASKANALSKQLSIKTYRLSDIAPEIVWDFGEPIPLIQQKKDTINISKEKQFGLIVNTGDSIILKSQFYKYKIERLYRINMHYRKSKKTRLIKDFYLITLKE